MPGARILKMVVMKLIAPRIEEMPARWMAEDREVHGGTWRALGGKRRIDGPACADAMATGRPGEEKGVRSSAKEAGSSQNEILFMRGNAMSGAPIIKGTIQLPNPPIIAGMIVKNIMMRPWALTNMLKTSGSPKICMPGYMSSARIPIESTPADHSAYNGEDEVHRADVFVIGRIDPSPPAMRAILVKGLLPGLPYAMTGSLPATFSHERPILHS